jgi:hypothetical protein
MNLDLLMWGAASGLPGSKQAWRDIALSHALNAARDHVRKDGSTYHIVDYSATTRKAQGRYTEQGLGNNSTWARGQAWAISGALGWATRPQLVLPRPCAWRPGRVPAAWHRAAALRLVRYLPGAHAKLHTAVVLLVVQASPTCTAGRATHSCWQPHARQRTGGLSTPNQRLCHCGTSQPRPATPKTAVRLLWQLSDFSTWQGKAHRRTCRHLHSAGVCSPACNALKLAVTGRLAVQMWREQVY